MTPGAIITSAHGRRFAAFPIGLVAMIADESDHFLLLSSPRVPGQWEPISGALEHGETPTEGVLREIREEAGTDLQVESYGVIHSGAYEYDAAIPAIVGVAFALRAWNRAVTPGDDMKGQQVRWASLAEIGAGDINPRAERGVMAVPPRS